MQLNPKEVIKNKWLIPVKETKIGPNGIDCSLIKELILEHTQSKNVLLNEKVAVPKNVLATFHQRSSLSRQGIFCTTGIWDSNYSGVVGCTIYNLSGKKIIIPKGERVGQLVFWKGENALDYVGKYKDNTIIKSKHLYTKAEAKK